MLQDLRYALRMLLKNPGFTIVVVATLALGIGANAAIFSVVNGVLLNPLPFPDPDQIVTVHQSKPNFEAGAIPYLNFVDLQRENRTLSSIAISRNTSFTLIGTGEAERVRARMISADYFRVLGVEPALGRMFIAEDDKQGASPVALLSGAFWRRKFGAAPDIVAKTITLDDRSYQVVGVIPETFTLHAGTDVYVPIGAWDSPALKNRGAALGIHGIGRMKPEVSLEQAQSDLSRVMADLAVAYPATNKGNGANLIPIKKQLVGEIRPILLLLLAAVGFVLLIACVNVSNLMLARSTARGREFAIRAALGAGQWRLLRQLLCESTLLSLLGGGLGLLVAVWGTKLALATLPTALPRADEVTLDTRVLAFTIAISLLTGILTGLAPALKSTRKRFTETLKEGARGTSSGRVRAQGVFVAIEMALALVLLIGAGLMIRSLNALWRVDPGFHPDNVLTFGLTLPPSMRSATANTTRATLRDLNARLAATPGVSAVSLSVGATPMQNEDDLYFWVEGEPTPQGHNDMHMALFYTVEPGYLKAMGISLKHGRFFTDQDDERAGRVMVIDEALAQQRFGTENPIGHRIHLDDNQAPYEIIGVVGHVKQWGLDADAQERLQAQLYIPFRGVSDSDLEGTTGVAVVIRTDGEPGPSFFSSLRQAVHSQSAQNVVANAQTMNEVIAGSLAQRRFSMILLGSFAAVALLLSSLGIYGVISYFVGQRTHELGIRMALGAKRTDILRLVLGHGMKMTIAGVAIGLLAAFGLTRLMTKMIYGVSATDPVTFAVIALILTLVALIACLVPARRATKVDPLVALRYE